MNKPVLDYVETEISEFCNLNCRGCCDFSNLAKEKKFYELDEFVKDYERLSELFSEIKKIRLMGGEPLLNPHVAGYAREARRIFPSADIRIVSNGLLIPKTDREIFRELKKSNVKFDISNYPPTRRIKKEIAAVLKDERIEFDFGVPMNYFFRNVLEKPADDPTPAFNNCIFTYCHMMSHGRISPCSYAFCIERFNAKYGTAYPETDCFDIYSDITGEQLIEAFSKPHEFCRCCGAGIIPIKWKGGVTAEKAKPSDWQIKENFINMKFAPVVQSVLKPAAVKARDFIQDKKR